MSNRIELVEPTLQQENITEAKENLLGGEKGLYLFHEHFSCFGHDHNPSPNQVSKYQPADLWEADTYRYEFNVAMFFKSLLVFLLDIFGLGLPIVLFTVLCGSKFLANLHWIETGVYILIYGCINTLLLTYSIYHGEFIFTDATTLLYLTGLVFYAIIGASFNSFINRKIPPLLESVELSLESRSNTGIAPLATEYGPQSELRRTILRLNIDASLFFFTFLENTGDERQFFKAGLVRPQTGFKEEEHMLIWDKQFNKADLITKALEFEKRVFNYKFLGKYTRYDKTKAHGLSYADTVLGRYQRRSREYRFFAISVCFGLAALSFMHLDSSDNTAESFVNRFIVKGGVLLLSILVTVLVLIEILKGAAVLGTRLDLVKGLGELISEEKPAQDSIFRENCSMINIFDPESLRTWASLRMVFMNMNSRRLDATSLGTSLIVAIQLIGLITLGFLYFTTDGQEKKAFFLQYIIFFGIPTLIYMMFVLFFIYFGSQVNNQYQEHIYLLKKLKMTIFKLFAMYPILDGEDGVQPSTYLYARGFRYLKQSFEGQEITKEVLDEKLQKINEAYEEIIEELETEEQYSPLKLLGIPMTDSFVNTLLGSIVTVMMIPVTNYLSDLTGWG